MNEILSRKFLLSLSLPLAAMLILTSAVGFFYPGFYGEASRNWQLQTTGQDGVDLFLMVPVLVISALASVNGNRLARSVWAGTNIYIAYTFAIYCFDVRFNSFFVLYCFILGLSFFSAAIFFYATAKDGYMVQAPSYARKLIGYFFITVFVVFYCAWLSDILPAIAHGKTPADVEEIGLLTNPVHVLDLSVLLPLVLVVGLLILKGNSLALSLATPLLTFFTFMDITIAVLAVMLARDNATTAPSIVGVVSGHALISVVIITLLWRKIEFINNARVWNFR